MRFPRPCDRPRRRWPSCWRRCRPRRASWSRGRARSSGCQPTAPDLGVLRSCRFVTVMRGGGTLPRAVPAPRVLCGGTPRFAAGPLALAGTQAAWPVSGGGNSLETCSTRWRRPARAGRGRSSSVERPGIGLGTYLNGLDGGGPLLAYARVKEIGDFGPECEFGCLTGHRTAIRRLVDGRPQTIVVLPELGGAAGRGRRPHRPARRRRAAHPRRGRCGRGLARRAWGAARGGPGAPAGAAARRPRWSCSTAPVPSWRSCRSSAPRGRPAGSTPTAASSSTAPAARCARSGSPTAPTSSWSASRRPASRARPRRRRRRERRGRLRGARPVQRAGRLSRAGAADDQRRARAALRAAARGLRGGTMMRGPRRPGRSGGARRGGARATRGRGAGRVHVGQPAHLGGRRHLAVGRARGLRAGLSRRAAPRRPSPASAAPPASRRRSRTPTRWS